jgi:hypothetical protein
MISITKYNDDGVIIATGTIQEQTLHLHEENVYVGEANSSEHYFLNDVLCCYTKDEISQKLLASKNLIWKMPERKLIDVRNIDAAKEDCLVMIKVKRKELEKGLFTYAEQLFQINETRINAAAEEARRLVKSFIKVWILADNSLIHLDYKQMLEIKTAQDKYISDLFNIYLQLKNKINIAKTIEEIDAIAWPA